MPVLSTSSRKLAIKHMHRESGAAGVDGLVAGRSATTGGNLSTPERGSKLMAVRASV